MSEGGIEVGAGDDCGCNCRNLDTWFLDNISAAQFCTPGMCETWIAMSNRTIST